MHLGLVFLQGHYIYVIRVPMQSNIIPKYTKTHDPLWETHSTNMLT